MIDPTLLLMHMKRLEGGNQSADRLLAAGGNYIKNHTHPLVYALPTPSRQFRYVYRERFNICISISYHTQVLLL